MVWVLFIRMMGCFEGGIWIMLGMMLCESMLWFCLCLSFGFLR